MGLINNNTDAAPEQPAIRIRAVDCSPGEYITRTTKRSLWQRRRIKIESRQDNPLPYAGVIEQNATHTA